MSGEQQINDLIKILKESPYSNEGRTASKELIDIGESAVPSLLSELEKYDRPSGEITALIQTLGEIGNAQAIPPLCRLLEQTEPGPLESMNSYWCISNALGRCGDQLVFPSLIDALCGAGHIEYGGAHSALIALGDEIVPSLLEVLAEPTPWIYRHLQLHHPHLVANSGIVERKLSSLRCSIIRILGEIGDDRAVPVLNELLNVSDPHLRDGAIDSLAEFGGEYAIPYWVRDLDREGAWACINAVEALNKLDVVKKQPEIIQKELAGLSWALNDEFANTRVVAAKVLARIDDPRVIPLLKEKLADIGEYSRYPNNNVTRVCDRIAELLMEIGTPEALAAIEEWQKKQEAKDQ